VGRRLLVHLLLLLLAPMLLHHLMSMMAGGAAGDRAEHGVMMRVMTSDRACRGPAKASNGLSAADGSKQSSGANRGEQETHDYNPSFCKTDTGGLALRNVAISRQVIVLTSS
jgi:hypothetical protein